jgi:hypothetical protein
MTIYPARRRRQNQKRTMNSGSDVAVLPGKLSFSLFIHNLWSGAPPSNSAKIIIDVYSVLRTEYTIDLLNRADQLIFALLLGGAPDSVSQLCTLYGVRSTRLLFSTWIVCIRYSQDRIQHRIGSAPVGDYMYEDLIDTGFVCGQEKGVTYAVYDPSNSAKIS